MANLQKTRRNARANEGKSSLYIAGENVNSSRYGSQPGSVYVYVYGEGCFVCVPVCWCVLRMASL